MKLSYDPGKKISWVRHCQQFMFRLLGPTISVCYCFVIAKDQW